MEIGTEKVCKGQKNSLCRNEHICKDTMENETINYCLLNGRR